jgi:Cation efflux system protein CusB domain 1
MVEKCGTSRVPGTRIPFYIGICFLFHPLMGLAVLLGAAVLCTIAWLAEVSARAPTRELVTLASSRRALSEATRRNAALILALGMRGKMAARWARDNDAYLDMQQYGADLTGGFGSLSRSFRMLLQSTVLGVGAYLVVEQEATPGLCWRMLIVPDADSLVAEVHVAPSDIDQVSPRQSAMLRFPTFNQRTTPEIKGTVKLVAADVTENEHTGNPYYVVRVGISPEEIARLRGMRLIPGMPVDVFIRTSERTMLSYLLKPLDDQVQRAFREK